MAEHFAGKVTCNSTTSRGWGDRVHGDQVEVAFVPHPDQTITAGLTLIQTRQNKRLHHIHVRAHAQPGLTLLAPPPPPPRMRRLTQTRICIFYLHLC